MKVKSIDYFNSQNDLKLTAQQTILLKGGDDDLFVNTGTTTTTINFTG